jgi:DNA-binding CsgD family transcriptional regulator
MALPSLVGRDAERSALLARLAAPSRSASTIDIVEGEPGIGKSALIDAVSSAIAPPTTVLRCCARWSEADLPYALLERLLHRLDLEPLVGETDRSVLRRVTAHDAQPVDGAGELDARAIGTALLAVFAALAPTGVVVVVDDAHWADAASATALAYAVRRVDVGGVATVLVRRPRERSTALDDVDATVTTLTALGNAALDELVASVAPQLSARRRRRIVDVATGNPLFAIELARAARATTTGIDLANDVHVPATITESLTRRLRDLEPGTVTALQLLALAPQPSTELVRTLGIGAEVRRADDEGWLRTGVGTVDFVHPLHAAAVVEMLTPGARRSLHARLADATASPVQRLRHRALAADDHDAALAAEVEDAIESTSADGLVERSTELAFLAVRLTPVDDPVRPRRLLATARLAFRCGETEVARRLFDELDASATDARTRVGHLVARAKLEFSADSAAAALDVAERALDVCRADADLSAGAELVEVHSLLSRLAYHDFAEAERHARAAYEAAAHLELDLDTRISLLIARGTAQLMVGDGLDHQLFETGLALEGGRIAFAHESVAGSYAVLLKIVDDLDGARTRLLALLELDDEGARPYVLSHLPQLELWAGNWDLAEEYAHQHLDAALRTGQHDQAIQARNNLASLDLHRGDLDAARAIARDLVDTGRAGDDAWTERSGEGLLGLVAMADGDAAAAVTHFERWEELADLLHLREPGYRRMRGDLVEALVACGRLDDADRHATEMTDDANRLDRPSLHGAARRATALVHAAAGRQEAAITDATAAVEILATTPLVLEHAKALLTLGQIHRRFKEKSAARRALTDALDVFDRLGAEPLAARTRLDLDRIGLRTSSPTMLTETERRVAMLAATGRTVRQVADELFISPKTVEANLTRVYRKLGVSGRVELAAWAAAQPAP